MDTCNAALRFGSRVALGEETTVSPAAEATLQSMLRGNEEFRTHSRNLASLSAAIRHKTAHEGQHPYAVVVCCADSRVPAEHIFTAGIGDLFVIRNAGNLMTPAALGSVEYAVAHLHVPLVLVMGHRGCGAVAAAMMDHLELGALGDLIDQVADNIVHASSPRQAEFKNMRASLAELGRSEVLRKLAAEGRVGFAGAIYDLSGGRVELALEDL